VNGSDFPAFFLPVKALKKKKTLQILRLIRFKFIAGPAAGSRTGGTTL
jgi:hypothetical protein